MFGLGGVGGLLGGVWGQVMGHAPQPQEPELPIQVQLAVNNDMIIKHLSSQLPFGMLKVLRLVNTQWEFGCRDAFYHSSKVELSSLEFISRYTRDVQLFIHSAYSIGFPTDETNLPNIQAFEAFCNKFHNQVLQLTLPVEWRNAQGPYRTFQRFATLDRIQDLRLIVKIGSQHPHHHHQGGGWAMDPITAEAPWHAYPSVKKLSMIWNYDRNAEHFWGDGFIFNLANLARVITIIFPNLEEFTLDDSMCIGAIPVNEFQQAFFQVLNENPQILSKLRGVSLSCNNQTPGYILQAPARRLKSLKLFFNTGWNPLCTENMARVLETHSSSLESLQLLIRATKVQPNRNNFFIGLRFPKCMPELKSLKLLFNKPEMNLLNLKFPIPPLNYDILFPKIRSLTINIVGRRGIGTERFRVRVFRKFIPKGRYANICNNITEIKMQVPGCPRESIKTRRIWEDMNTRIAHVFPNGWHNVKDELSKEDWRLFPKKEWAMGKDWEGGASDRVAFWRT